MGDMEQQPGTSDIGQKPSETPEVGAPTGDIEVVSSEPAQIEPEENGPATRIDRSPLVGSEGHLLPLILSGLIATIMTVCFIAGVESIFPGPAPVPERSSGSEAGASVPSDSADSTTDTDSGVDSEPEGGAATPESAPTEPSACIDVHHALPGRSLLASIRPTGLTAGFAAATDASADDRPGPFGRTVILIRFVVVLMLGVGCGLVALGGLALSLDRPLGSVPGALVRMMACAWIASLALLIPAPAPWMLAPIHYAAAGLLLWGSMMFFFRLQPRTAGVLLGGSVSLLAVTVLGSSVVLWAAWG